MEKQIKAKKLVADCEKSLSSNEYETRTLKRVRCSASDVATVQLYAETIANHGSYTGQLMQPRGNVAAVLVNCGLYESVGEGGYACV